MTYRGQPEQRTETLVSATFATEIAHAHFTAGRKHGVLHRSELPIDRLFMTFVETPVMNQRYQEAEAVLFSVPGTPI